MFHWGLGSIALGLYYLPEISLGYTPMHPVYPRRGSEVGLFTEKTEENYSIFSIYNAAVLQYSLAHTHFSP